MDKKEILEKSRQENKGWDERERSADAQAGRIAAGVGLIACAVLNLLEVLSKGETNFVGWIIYCTIYGTLQLTRYAKLKKKNDLLFGCIMLGCDLVFVVLYLGRLFHG